MAKRLTLEPEVQDIFCHIDNGDNFLLSGGAGSGKTYSLVQVIKQVIEENPNSKVACMTYTNAAVKEITERVNHKNIVVSTIHDFLWNNIKHFQRELKTSLIQLMNDAESKIKSPEDVVVNNNYFDGIEKGIQYKEYLKIKEGIISHDEVLIVANHLFKNYPKLCDILKDKFKFIFIDEYQDTSRNVIEILLDHLKQSSKKNTIGFFGDAMQSIYDDGIGNLDDYKGNGCGMVKEIKKIQNRRNPELIIKLANKLRSDGVIQKSSDDKNAPNMNKNGQLKDGSMKFLYSQNDNLPKAREYMHWDFSNTKETKELNLTHNLIAPKAGFPNLMEIYDRDPIIKLKNAIIIKMKDNKKSGKTEIILEDKDTFDQVVDKFQLNDRERRLKKDVLLESVENSALYNQLRDLPFSEVKKIYLDKDQLIDDKKQDKDDEQKKGSKRDNLIRHLFKIQNNISFYKNQKFSEFIKATDYYINNINDKRNLKENIESLVNVLDKTIEQIINEANEKGLCKIDDNLEKFKTEKKYVYDRVKLVKFSEFQKLYEYLEGYTPYSTKHKTKGTEFNNVFIILDNGKWNDYNFEYLFLNSGTQSVLTRTQKIFYMCCTRAKENIAVYYQAPSMEVVRKAGDWFGRENIVNLDQVQL